MDPATEITGGLPVSADSLYGIIPTTLMNDNRTIDLDFGPDGALYVAELLRVELHDQQRQHRRLALRLHRRRRHAGSRPAGRRRRRTRRAGVAFNIGKSGGVSYKWDFADGGTRHRRRRVSHTYLTGGHARHGHADGDLRRRRRRRARRSTSRSRRRCRPRSPRDVPKLLGLTLGAAASFGAFVPGVAQHLHGDHDGQRHLDDAGNAALTSSTRARRARATWSTAPRRWRSA